MAHVFFSNCLPVADDAASKDDAAEGTRFCSQSFSRNPVFCINLPPIQFRRPIKTHMHARVKRCHPLPRWALHRGCRPWAASIQTPTLHTQATCAATSTLQNCLSTSYSDRGQSCLPQDQERLLLLGHFAIPWPLLIPRVCRENGSHALHSGLGNARTDIIKFRLIWPLDRPASPHSPAWHRVCVKQTCNPFPLERQRGLPTALGSGQWAWGW